MLTGGGTGTTRAGVTTRREGVQRTQWYQHVAGDELLVVLDRPEGRPAGLFVIAHGLTGDRSGPVELLARLSAELVRRTSFAVVRPDLAGSGDSTGRFSHTTFARMSADVRAVADAAVHRLGMATALPRVYGGISIGGVPAVLAAADDDACAGILLLSSDLVQGVRFLCSPVQPIRNGEFHLPLSFFREREALRPRDVLQRLGVPVTLVLGSRDDKLVDAAGWFRARGHHVVELEADHLFDRPGIRQQLADVCAAALTPATTGVPLQSPQGVS